MPLKMERLSRNRAAVALAVFSFIMIAAMAAIFMWEPESPVSPRKRGVIGVIEIQGVIEDTEYAGTLSAAVRSMCSLNMSAASGPHMASAVSFTIWMYSFSPSPLKVSTIMKWAASLILR